MVEMDGHMLGHIADLGTKITGGVDKAFDGESVEGVSKEVDLLLQALAIDPGKNDDDEVVVDTRKIVGAAIVVSTNNGVMVESLRASGLHRELINRLIVAFTLVEGHDNRYWIATAIYELYWTGRRRGLFYHELLSSLVQLTGLANLNQNYMVRLTAVIDDIREQEARRISPVG